MADYGNIDRLFAHLEQTPLAFIEWDLEFKVIEWNKSAEQVFGYTKDEALGCHASFIIPHEARKHVDGVWQSLLAQTGGSRSSNYNINKDGEHIFCEWYNTTLRNESNQSIGVASLILDVTETEKARTEIAAERRFTQMSLDAQTDTFFLFDPSTGEAIKWNKAFERVSGYSHDEIAKLPAPGSYYSDQDLKRAGVLIENVIKTGSDSIVLDLICKDGKIVPTEYNVSSVLDDQGEVQYFISIGRDISQRIAHETKSAGFHRLIESSLNEIYIFNETDYRFTEVNFGARSNIGYTMDELSAMTPLDIKPNFTLEKFNHLVEPLRKGSEKMIRFSTVHERKNGSTYPVEVYLQLIQIGDPVFVAIILDVTEREEADRLIRESQIQYEKLFNQIADPIVIFAQDGHQFLDCNESALETYGYTKKEILTMTPFDLHPPDDFDKVAKNIDDKKNIAPNEYLHITKSGYIFSVEIHTQELLYNQQPAWISIIRDITERKTFESELKQAKDRAERSDHLKSAFLANMSHEIRTPMNAILGFTDILREVEDITPADRKQAVEVIQDSGERLLSLINDLIDVSKIEAGEINLIYSEFKVSDVCERLSQQFGTEAASKGIMFNSHGCVCQTGLSIISDRIRLLQVFSNLIKNALKFTNEGSIEIGCKSSGEFVEFYVEDTGLGIRKEDQEVIFNRFTRIVDSKTIGVEGTGLGLSISKAIVEKLGGEIGLESEEGKGSRFYFTVPKGK